MLAVTTAKDHFFLSQTEPAEHCQDQVEEGPADLTLLGHCQDEETAADVRKLKGIGQVDMQNTNTISFLIIRRFYPILSKDFIQRELQILYNIGLKENSTEM